LTAGYYATGDLIPLIPGDPGVFKALADNKSNAPPCWLPDSFDGVEWQSKLDQQIEGIAHFGHVEGYEHEISISTLRSLERAGLFNPETGEFNGDIRAWMQWDRENGTEPHGRKVA